MKKVLISAFTTFLLGGIYFYFLLPAINLKAFDFYLFLIFLIIVYNVSYFILSNKPETIVNTFKYNANFFKRFKIHKYSFLTISLIIMVIFVINIILSPFFNSNIYKNRITIDRDNEFKEDIKEINLSALPIIDKDSSQRLGDRVMGQLPELVSQFKVSDLYTQINYNNAIIRVTPLEFSDFFKWLGNRSTGTSGYVSVNSVTGEALLNQGFNMKVMPSAFFNDNLFRNIRFNYPTKIFDTPTFEIDDEGNPFWIIPSINYKGVGIIKDVEGVVILDPSNGNSNYYSIEETPEWVDHVYPSDLVLEQIEDNGLYNKGFLNSIFGQKNVVAPTKGYNYTVINKDVYLYTGITSVIGDESNIGFILTNLRTKKTNFYQAPGAEEFSAMASAEGQVQQMNYNSTFPLLVNIGNKPTYFVSLKDRAGLVKMYAFVDVLDYQRVVVTDSSLGMEKALENYLRSSAEKENTLKEITILSFKDIVIDGFTNIYIVTKDNDIYIANISDILDIYSNISIDETYKVEFYTKNNINYITKMEL